MVSPMCYVIYGTGEMMELKPDLSDVIEGTYQHIFQREADENGLLEGSRMIKHNGKYYLMMISQANGPGRHRRGKCATCIEREEALREAGIIQ